MPITFKQKPDIVAYLTAGDQSFAITCDIAAAKAINRAARMISIVKMKHLFVLMSFVILLTQVRTNLSAQTMSIRLVNGSSGKPLPNKNIIVIWCPDCFTKTVVRIRKDGIGHVMVPDGASTISLIAGPKEGSESNRIAYIDCNAQPMRQTSVAEILAKGVSPNNGCSFRGTNAKPGELIFWAKERPWWKPDMQ